MTTSPYRVGAAFVLLSAILHIIAPLIGGMAAAWLLPAGVIYLIIVAGLNRGMRWLAYVTFLIMAVGGIIALSQVWTSGPVPGWLWLAIVAADWLAMAALFAALWRSAPEPA